MALVQQNTKLSQRNGESRDGKQPNPNNSKQIQTKDKRCYELNIEKSLEKKLIAAKRVKNLKYEYTGGGIVAEADAATYELLKIAAIQYYKSYSKLNETAHITDITDNSGKSIVQNTIRVCEQSGKKSYTINFNHLLL